MTEYKLVPVEPTPDMTDLIKRLRIKAGMMELGEIIAWGSDSALMREAADVLGRAGSAPAVQGEPVAYALFASNGSIRIWCADPVHVETLRQQYGEALQPLYAAPQPAPNAPTPTFQLGDRVRKTKGSQWKGRVVGTYSTSLTPEGYAVESDTEKGSVQIYPVGALDLVGEES